MAEQHRDYEDYRRGGRREWNGRTYEDGPSWSEERSVGGEHRRYGRSQDFGGRYSDDGYSMSESGGYGSRPSEFGGRGSFESSGYGRGREFSGDRGFGGERFGNERGFSGERFGGERGFARERGFESERGYGPRRQEFERGRGMEPDPWQGGPETHSFGGQRTYARDLYSDSGASRHETDWTSGNAGRGMQSVYSGSDWRPERSNFGSTYGSTFGRYQDEAGTRTRYGYAGRGPKDYQRSDERIREEISDRMTDDDSLDASNITVQVQKGEVTLTGTVTTREQKRRAEDLAEGSSGVREVTNNVRVSRETEGVDLNQGSSIQVGQTGTSATKDLGTKDQGRTKN